MIQKLKVECGSNHVSKMSQMYRDIHLSRDLQVEFGEHLGQKQIEGVEFTVQVLTSGTWPQMEQAVCNLPRELTTCVERFEVYYLAKNDRRKLQWLHTNGSAELHVLYTAKKYQLVVSVFQAAILCLFNEVSEATYKEIRERTNVSVDYFEANMKALCHPRTQVLLKQQLKRPIFNENEKIKVNTNFTSNQIRNSLVPQRALKKKSVEPTANETAQAN